MQPPWTTPWPGAPAWAPTPDSPTEMETGSDDLLPVSDLIATALIVRSIGVQRLEDSDDEVAILGSRRIESGPRWVLALGSLLSLGATVPVLRS